MLSEEGISLQVTSVLGVLYGSEITVSSVGEVRRNGSVTCGSQRPDATGRRYLEASVVVVVAVVVAEAAASQETIEPSENNGEFFSLGFFPSFFKISLFDQCWTA